MAYKSKEQLIKEIDQFGMFTKSQDFILTGYPLLDCYFSGEDEVKQNVGGFPRGKMISISGENGVGKSTFILYVLRNILKSGMKVIYCDIEDGLNEKSLEGYKLSEYTAKNLREYLNGDKTFYPYNPITYTQTISTLQDICAVQKPDMIIIDSYKALRPSKIHEVDDIEDTGAILADKKIEGIFFPALKDLCRVYGLTIIGLNQVRLRAKGLIFFIDEPQGNAFLHWHDQRYFLKKVDKIEKPFINNLGEKDKKETGNVVQLLSKKNRFGMRSLTLPIFFGKGISFIYMYYLILLNNKYIELNKSSGTKIFRIPGIYEGTIDEKTGKMSGVSCSTEQAAYKLISDKFDEIENFITENGLIYIEKSMENGNDEGLF